MDIEFKEFDAVKTECLIARGAIFGAKPNIIRTWNVGYILRIIGPQQALCKMIAPDLTPFEKIYRFDQLYKNHDH